jgi:hypothetical protein
VLQRFGSQEIEVRGLKIRKAEPVDFEAIWPIFHEVVSAGETYPFAPDTSKEEAFDIWMVKPQVTFVAELNGEIVGTYFLKANQPGLGNHVCNCGYMVSPGGAAEVLLRPCASILRSRRENAALKPCNSISWFQPMKEHSGCGENSALK